MGSHFLYTLVGHDELTVYCGNFAPAAGTEGRTIPWPWSHALGETERPWNLMPPDRQCGPAANGYCGLCLVPRPSRLALAVGSQRTGT